MRKFQRLIESKRGSSEHQTPIVLNPKIPKEKARLLSLASSLKTAFVVDEFLFQEDELKTVNKPKLLFKSPRLFKRKDFRGDVFKGVWVYLPWRRTLIHILEKERFYQLRTSRNLNLILPREQALLSGARVAIAGLNVGNPAALCLALEGVQDMRLADNDVLTVSNLNRFRAGLTELGVNKAVLSARQIYEINPFARLSVFPNGVESGKLEDFLLRPKVDVLVEEMDHLKLKIEIREVARRLRIPVVMVTGNGENVIIDIERFDQNPHLKLMSGYLRPKIISAVKKLNQSSSFKEKLKLARDFMGVQYLHPRLRQSFNVVGEKIAGIPQIAESSFLRGAVVAYIVRQIITRKRIPSGRYSLRLDTMLK